MCTVTGTIHTPDGELYDGLVSFTPSPQAARLVVATIVTGAEVEVEIVSGALSVDLEPGLYLVRFPDTRKFSIDVPDDAATADIADCIVSGVSSYSPMRLIRIVAADPTAGTRVGGELLHINSSSSAAWYWDGSAWQTLVAAPS